MGIQCPRAFSQSECLDHLPLLRLVGWTRARLTPPLEHLYVWGEKGTINDAVVDYTSTTYLQEHLRGLTQEYDAIIVKGMATRCLIIETDHVPLFQLHSTVFFRWLQHLELTSVPDHEIPFLPWLEQIKTLEIASGRFPEYSLNLVLPLTQTLQCLKLDRSTSSWMLGRSFKALREFHIKRPSFLPQVKSRHEGLQLGLPACTELQVEYCRFNDLRFLSCSNVQSFRWSYALVRVTLDLTALNSIRDCIFKLSCLQNLYICISLDPLDSGLDSLIKVVFRDAREQGVWRDIRSVEMNFWNDGSSEGSHLFDRTVGHQHLYEKWWKEFTVTKHSWGMVIVRASV